MGHTGSTGPGKGHTGSTGPGKGPMVYWGLLAPMVYWGLLAPMAPYGPSPSPAGINLRLALARP